jgi:hypothetical protein
MKRIDWRIVVGSLLILAGLTTLLETTGLIPPDVDLFWGIVGGLAGAAFLYVLVSDPRANWWAAFPAMVLLGIGAAALLPESLDGLAFLGSVSLAFWIVYLLNRQHWWAIIPGGVLLTLAVVSALSDTLGGVDTGGVFFLGLGLTFLLVALLAHYSWAYIPAAALILLAVALGLQFGTLMDYVWIAALFLSGLALILFALRRR